MVSGKYSALSGALAREQTMGNIAANLANVNTTGFKKDRVSFESILQGSRQINEANGINYSRLRKIGTDFEQGGIQPTGKPLDVAISGEGFFKVRRQNDIFYTRAGHFMLDENGMLKTPDGMNVIGAGNQPLQLTDVAGKAIDIADNGNISINGVFDENALQVFNINDEEKLIKTKDNLYRLDQGGADQPMDNFRVIQGSLETSNVNMMEEMATMINTQRKFEAHFKVIEGYSKLGEKQNELGSVG